MSDISTSEDPYHEYIPNTDDGNSKKGF